MNQKVIQIHDKKFEPFIKFDKIDEAVERIAKRMNEELHDKKPLFIAVLNGSFMFASDLFHKIDFPCEITFVKLASYSGTKSTENVRQLIGIDEDIVGRNVVVVEDIIDSGLTIERVLAQLKMIGAAEIKIATLLYKPNAFKGSYDIDYVGLEIGNDFIVGYGLDYEKHGRNYKDIYKIIE
ncbi:MAG: hypoxanthine phosphoribosyltransferase [Cyclobacteriaceae bacterium]|jgi:hypoxanthine phosphoribosyltransferase